MIEWRPCNSDAAITSESMVRAKKTSPRLRLPVEEALIACGAFCAGYSIAALGPLQDFVLYWSATASTISYGFGSSPAGLLQVVHGAL